MTGDDMERFSQAMGTLEHAYRLRLSPETVHAYARGLEDLTIVQIERAIDKAIRTSPRLPTIAAVRELVERGGRVELPGVPKGTYPPDIARRRRQLGLPVTPEEHAAYARGETTEPLVTTAQMARTLRDVAPRANPVLRAVFLELAAKMEHRMALSEADLAPAGPMGQVIRNVQAREARDREPGSDG